MWWRKEGVRRRGQRPLRTDLRRTSRRLAKSGLFDPNWYLAQNPDVAAAGVDPLVHYLQSGAAEGRDPNPFFDTDWYAAEYPDVAAAGVNPLLHYLESGAAEGRNPGPRFDSDWYAAQNPDVGEAGTNPLAHFLRAGATEGRDPLSSGKATKRATVAQRLAAEREQQREKARRLTAELNEHKESAKRLAAEIEERKEKAKRLSADLDRRGDQRNALAAQLAKREAEAKRLAKVIDAFNRADPMPARAAVRHLPSEPHRHPMVSGLILTRNGKHLLDAMLRSLHSVNSYPNLELIIVDHASDDGTRELLEAWGGFCRLRVIAYDRNQSFAFSNNRAAEMAEGELLLLLNNDVVFESDVIPRMVAALEEGNVGAAGVKQYPGTPFGLEDRGPNHIGVRLRWDRGGYLRPYNAVPGPLDGVIAIEPSSFPAVTASILMCRRSDYLALGGLNESYLYGSEDIDFCSKVRLGLGKEIVSLNDIHVLHNESTTRSLDERRESGERRARNRTLLRKRFGYRLRREFKETLLRDDGSLTGKRFVAAFAVTSVDMASGAADLHAALGLGEALRRLCNWDIRYLPPASWYEAADVDLYIAMSDETDIRRLGHSPPHLTTVGWLRRGTDRWVGQPWFELFDVRLCSSSAGAKYVSERSGLSCQVLPMAASLNVFHPGPPVPEHQADYLLVDNAGADSLLGEREEFEPSRLPYRFAIHGEAPERLAAYRREPVEYGDLPKLYSSAPIIIDSEGGADRAGLECVVFDALACGSLVLTNDASGAAESFGNRLPVWGTAEELVRLLDFHLRNPKERQALARSLRDAVATEHSFDARARDLLRLLTDHTSRYRTAIKCPAATGETPAQPGFDVARSLATAFRAHGHEVRIDLPDDWDAPRAMADDVVIVVGGAEGYKPAVDQINIGWGMDAAAAAEVPYDRMLMGAAADNSGDGVAVLLDAIEQCHSQRMAVPRDQPLSETRMPVDPGAGS
jgi:GT2 family glycosyltransferase